MGEKRLRIAPLGIFTLGCAHALCESHVTPCWHCSWTPSTMGMLAHCSGVSDVAFTGTRAETM